MLVQVLMVGEREIDVRSEAELDTRPFSASERQKPFQLERREITTEQVSALREKILRSRVTDCGI